MKRSYDHLAATTFLLFGALLANACGASPPDTGPSGAQSSDVYTIGLTAASPGALPKCSSALAGTTAYVQSPTGLWSCINNTWIDQYRKKT